MSTKSHTSRLICYYVFVLNVKYQTIRDVSIDNLLYNMTNSQYKSFLKSEYLGV